MPTDLPNNQPGGLGQLNSGQYERLLKLIEPFEKACQEALGHATVVDLTPHVPRREEPLFRDALHELIKIDLEQRWRHKQRTRLDDYIGRFPELKSLADLPVDLVHEEYRARWRFGDRPTLQEYRERFPRQFTELKRRVEVEPDPTLEPPTGAVDDSLAAIQPLVGDQYEIKEELGRGGMGVVYRAYDHKHKRLVALKTMRRLDPLALYRFKNEFRALADVTHPNLVALYEMVTDGHRGFFTMELVDGCNLLTYVRRVTVSPVRETLPDLPTKVNDGPEKSRRDQAARPLTPEQIDRLRHTIGQLTEALLALHEAGKLHRDIKPSNVLVTPEGRVIVLDFGLVAAFEPGGGHDSTGLEIMGTPAYMAPEQAAVLPLSPATDWYAIGVILFEALTGRLPFDGGARELLLAKQSRDAPAPSDLVTDVPEDWNELTAALLRRDAAARPDGQAILESLGLKRGEASPPAPQPLHGPASPFVGRQEQLQTLEDAYQELLRGQPVTIYVHGRSGAGKTAMVQRFLDGLRRRGDTVVLAGRCYEQESVPYKALDSVIDALSRYLGRLATLEVQALLPRDVSALARVFPVLGRVPAVASAPRRGLDVTDPQELRRRALAALRELLGRLGDTHRLIVSIDDLQWGDTDSAALLLDLIQPPDAPVMLLLGCYRREDVANSPCLKSLLRPTEPGRPRTWREVAVEPLTAGEAKELALALLRQGNSSPGLQAEFIAHEAGGSPFFVYELVQHFQGAQGAPEPASGPAGDLTLNEVLWSRILRLPEAMRRLLEVVAVAGRPIQVADACQAAAWEGDERPALAYLRSGRLLRTTGSHVAPLIETYHDRIRETVAAHLGFDVRRQHHRRLAEVLEVSRGSDSEALAVHFQGAGLNKRAAHFYALAAAQASQALAFDHAAKLYRLALELGGQSEQVENRRQLRVALADALANAGRGAESAREYLTAVNGATPAEGRELQRRAAMQMLMSGHVDAGLNVLETVLNAAGMKLPASPWHGFLGLVFRRVQLLFRGLNYQPREVAQVPPELLEQVNVCWAAAMSLSMVNVFHGAYFQTRGLLLALKAGEPLHLARALALESAHEAIHGTRNPRRTKQLFQKAEEVSRRITKPSEQVYIKALLLMAHCTATALEGDWPEAVRLGNEADTLFRESCAGVAWELGTCQRFTLWPLMYMGDVPAINRQLPAMFKEAQERDDLYGLTNLCLVIRTFVRLADDQPERAREELTQVMDQWTRRGFHVQHMNRMFDECRIDLYEGRPQEAWQRLEDTWPAVKKSHFLKVQQVAVFLGHLRGSCAAALALRGGSDSRNLWKIAARHARALRNENADWATALGQLLQVAVDHQGRGRLQGRPFDLMNAAIALCRKTSMHLYAAAGLRRLGSLCDPSQGRPFLDESHRLFGERNVRNEDRMTAMLVPGFPEAP